MRTAFLVLLAVLLFSPTSLLFARGSDEDETSQIAEPTDAITEEPADEITGEDANPSSEEPDASVDDEGFIPMDEATAEILLQMGIYAFQDRIPSEDFVLADLNGDDMTLAEQRGKVVFLNFWATWCGPCREEMPSMQTLYDELKDEGFEIVAVNVREDRDTASGFVEANGFTYPVLLDLDGRVTIRYGIRAYPTTYIVDRDGHVLGVRPGYNDWATEEVVAAFRSLLAQ
jgi:thiol-disulfide isomerase/thioredoxin